MASIKALIILLPSKSPDHTEIFPEEFNFIQLQERPSKTITGFVSPHPLQWLSNTQQRVFSTPAVWGLTKVGKPDCLHMFQS